VHSVFTVCQVCSGSACIGYWPKRRRGWVLACIASSTLKSAELPGKAQGAVPTPDPRRCDAPSPVTAASRSALVCKTSFLPTMQTTGRLLLARSGGVRSLPGASLAAAVVAPAAPAAAAAGGPAAAARWVATTSPALAVPPPVVPTPVAPAAAAAAGVAVGAAATAAGAASAAATTAAREAAAVAASQRQGESGKSGGAGGGSGEGGDVPPGGEGGGAGGTGPSSRGKGVRFFGVLLRRRPSISATGGGAESCCCRLEGCLRVRASGRLTAGVQVRSTSADSVAGWQSARAGQV